MVLSVATGVARGLSASGGAGGGGVPVLEAFQYSSAGGGTANNIVLTAPAGIQAGELLVLIVCTEGNNITMSSGSFNKLAQSPSGAGTLIGVFYKVSTGAEGDQTVTFNGTASQLGWYLRVSGVNTLGPINVSNFNEVGLSPVFHTIPSITTTVPNCLAIYGSAVDGADAFPVVMTGADWTEQDQQTNGTGTTEPTGSFGTKDMAIAGATGDVVITPSANDGASFFQLAIEGA